MGQRWARERKGWAERGRRGGVAQEWATNLVWVKFASEVRVGQGGSGWVVGGQGFPGATQNEHIWEYMLFFRGIHLGLTR